MISITDKLYTLILLSDDTLRNACISNPTQNSQKKALKINIIHLESSLLPSSLLRLYDNSKPSLRAPQPTESPSQNSHQSSFSSSLPPPPLQQHHLPSPH